MVIGITGGVGCGKSTVMNLLQERYQAKVLEADQLGHQAMEMGSPVYEQIRETFGKSILRSDGQIDRKKLADLIYGDDRKREQLNAIVHPYVLNRIRQTLADWREEPLVCLETALLFETGCDTLCDEVWCIVTEKPIRIRRLMEARGYKREKAEAIMKVQLPDEEWIRRSDVCIENNGDRDKLERRLQELLGTE